METLAARFAQCRLDCTFGRGQLLLEYQNVASAENWTAGIKPVFERAVRKLRPERPCGWRPWQRSKRP